MSQSGKLESSELERLEQAGEQNSAQFESAMEGLRQRVDITFGKVGRLRAIARKPKQIAEENPKTVAAGAVVIAIGIVVFAYLRHRKLTALNDDQQPDVALLA